MGQPPDGVDVERLGARQPDPAAEADDVLLVKAHLPVLDDCLIVGDDDLGVRPRDAHPDGVEVAGGDVEVGVDLAVRVVDPEPAGGVAGDAQGA